MANYVFLASRVFCQLLVLLGVAATVQGFPLSVLCSHHPPPPHAACSLAVTESLLLPELCLPACSRLCVVASNLGHLAAALHWG